MKAEDKDRIIELVLCGDLAMDSAEVQAAMESNPGLRAELKEIQELQALMQQDASEMSSALDAEAAGTVIEGPWFKRHGKQLILLAASVMLIAALPFFKGGTQEPGFTYPGVGDSLGGPGKDLDDSEEVPDHKASPVGPSGSFEDFQYLAVPTVELQRLSFQIWAEGSDMTSPPLLSIPTFEGTACKLTISQMELLPDAIQWRVDVFGPSTLAEQRSAVFHATR